MLVIGASLTQYFNPKPTKATIHYFRPNTGKISTVQKVELNVQPVKNTEVYNKQLPSNNIKFKVIEESKNEDPRKDGSQCNSIMRCLKVNTQTKNYQRLGTYKLIKCRQIIKTHSSGKRTLLWDLSELRNYHEKFYKSKEPSPQEIQIEKMSQKLMPELLQTVIIKRC